MHQHRSRRSRSNWLARHLGSFQIAHPDAGGAGSTRRAIWSTSPARLSMSASGRAAAHWPGLVSTHLLVPRRFHSDAEPPNSPTASVEGTWPICSACRSSTPKIAWWKAWFVAAGSAIRMSWPGVPGSSMGSQASLASAAVAGLRRGHPDARAVCGRACRRPPRPAVRSSSGDDGHAYWLVYPEARRNVPKIKAFREWILGEVAASPAKPGA